SSEAAQSAADATNGIPAPWASWVARFSKAGSALMQQLYYRFVMQLVVPAPKPITTDDLVNRLMRLPRQRGRPNNPEAQLRGTQSAALPGVVTQSHHQRPSIRTIIFYQIPAGMVGWRIHHLANPYCHVLIFKVRRLQPGKIAIQATHNM